MILRTAGTVRADGWIIDPIFYPRTFRRSDCDRKLQVSDQVEIYHVRYKSFPAKDMRAGLALTGVAILFFPTIIEDLR